MQETKIETQFGFICPGHLQDTWDPRQCSIEPTTDGNFVVLDHSIQLPVYRAKTRKECKNWLYHSDHKNRKVVETKADTEPFNNPFRVLLS